MQMDANFCRDNWYDEREHNFFQRNDQLLLDGLIDFFHLKATMQLPFPFGPTNEMNAIKCYVRAIGIYDESSRVTENVPSFGMQIYELFKRFDHCEEPLSRYFSKICDVSLLGSDMVSPYKVVLDPLTQRIPIIIFCMDPATWNCKTLKYFVETMEKTQTLIITTCCRKNETPISTIRQNLFRFLAFLVDDFRISVNLNSCGVHKADKVDRITCARTGWKVRYVTSRVENKRGVRAETSSANQRSRSQQPSFSARK
ncbi:hypothetical protein ACTXT7_012747 [Hymenolepis weldensis]